MTICRTNHYTNIPGKVYNENPTKTKTLVVMEFQTECVLSRFNSFDSEFRDDRCLALTKYLMVTEKGFEPLTFTLWAWRADHCSTPKYEGNGRFRAYIFCVHRLGLSDLDMLYLNSHIWFRIMESNHYS